MTRSNFFALALSVPLALPLLACSEPGRQVAAPANAATAMTEMDMPDGTPVDMAAVPTYPGSRMVDAKIMPHMPDDMMSMSYDTPAAPAVVLAWYAAELGKQGYFLDESAKTLSGTDAKGKAIRVDTEETAGGHSLVTISKG